MSTTITTIWLVEVRHSPADSWRTIGSFDHKTASWVARSYRDAGFEVRLVAK